MLYKFLNLCQLSNFIENKYLQNIQIWLCIKHSTSDTAKKVTS